MKVRILIKISFKYKKWNYINSHNPIKKKKKKKLWLKLYLELWLRGFVNCLKRDLFLLLLKSPSYGQSNWGKLFFKASRSCPTLESLCYFVWGGTLWSFRFFGLLLLTGWGRILKLGILGRLGDWRGYTLLTRNKAWSSYGWREKDIFWLSQLKRSINPCSVECFFPGLSVVGSAYGGNLCP